MLCMNECVRAGGGGGGARIPKLAGIKGLRLPRAFLLQILTQPLPSIDSPVAVYLHSLVEVCTV